MENKLNKKPLVILILILAVAGYFVSAKVALHTWPFKKSAIIPAISLSPSVSPTNELVGWPTYRNEKYGFELRYPIGWEAPILNDSGVSDGQTLINLDIQNAITNADIQMVNDTTFKSVGTIDGNVSLEKSIKVLPSDTKEVRLTNGVGLYYINTDSQSGPSPTAYLISKDRVFLIETSGVFPGNNLSGTEDLFLKIISTFKFIK
jgi:hypothetical protein